MGTSSIMANSDSQQHRDYITVINAFAALSVVALHCNSCFWFGPAQGRSWYTSNIIETTLFCAVPLFFMITGVTLLDYRKRMSTLVYLKKRVEKTVVPFFVWSIVSLVWAIIVPWKGVGDDKSITAVISALINYRYCPVYWFFPPLFAIYLSIPILSLIENKELACKYISCIGILFVSSVPFSCSLLGITWNQAYTPPLVAGYLMYPAIGWVIDHERPSPNVSRWVYIAGIVGWAMQLIGVFITSTSDGVNRIFKGYVNLPAVMQSCALFLMFRSIDWRNGVVATRIRVLCEKLSSLTFGVYLTHWFVIDFVLHVIKVNEQSIIWRTAGAIAVYSFCSCLTFLLKRIPIIRHVVP